jgi:hypothetical protein
MTVLHSLFYLDKMVTDTGCSTDKEMCCCSLLHDCRGNSAGFSPALDRTSLVITVKGWHKLTIFHKNCQNWPFSAFKHALKHVNKVCNAFRAPAENNSSCTYNTPHCYFQCVMERVEWDKDFFALFLHISHVCMATTVRPHQIRTAAIDPQLH